ncbi:hypothetical protein DM02DRAFT_654214 [Periconia macrospinosa]|uniref:Amidohydrolase 3 domain-containing protein n=1 Tax=Periconia macrospinosa TaxID=97972 RepID=A0A2V1DWV3_9PLEO|nr:hypothetical protein DM02DRAFT_654214 [Periconia macrospinosa]
MSHAADVTAYKQATTDTGIDGILHVPHDRNLTDAVIQQIKTNGQFVTPTLAIFAAALHRPNPAIIHTSARPTVIYNTRALYRAGIPLLAGTDTVGPIAPEVSIPYGATLHQELGSFVETIGMTPEEATNAATADAAKYHKLDDRGVIREGMRTDLLLLGSNPLEDIKNTRDVAADWVGGRKYPGPSMV